MTVDIYKIRHLPSGKSYIGKTKDLKRRLRDHFGLRSKSCRYLSAAIAKYGHEDFECILLHQCKDEDANALERACILNARSRAPNGYNLSPGGEGGTHHPDTIALMKQKAALRKEAPMPGCLKVAQYNLTGELTKVHDGVTMAARSIIGDNKTFQETRGAAHNIQTSITGANKQVTAYGNRWRYVRGGDVPVVMLEPLSKQLHPSCRGVGQYDAHRVLIKTFPSVSAAAKAVGAKNQNINAVCHGIRKTCRGFVWNFTDLRARC